MAHHFKNIVLILQGGGSLGSYHIGVYQALSEFGYTPNILAGISIGAFTASLIAGNQHTERVEKLRQFWGSISWPDFPKTPGFEQMRTIHHKISSLQGILFGQPNFFVPRVPGPKLYPRGAIAATSYYDTSRLKTTLQKHIDFNYLNSRETRLILGATRVKDGEQVFFDNQQAKIIPEHVMASGAMPPGFPGVRIDGDLYWDGGCVASTPIEKIYRLKLDGNTLIFFVDLFSAQGEEPGDMDEVNIRAKDILYTSRSLQSIKSVMAQQNFGKELSKLFRRMPSGDQDKYEMKTYQDLMREHTLKIVHLVSQPSQSFSMSRDCEFSSSSLEERSLRGYLDTKSMIENKVLKDDSESDEVYTVMAGKTF